ncbi:hypothetical protein [Legionella saoudiensis]|uniref:hypothetical protein n=1 Tax=Legionella saoudiensis TaxID=1750561 RepID=UPI00072FE23F|nr:hypothetical protein [Legionella saoudiensis]
MTNKTFFGVGQIYIKNDKSLTLEDCIQGIQEGKLAPFMALANEKDVAPFYRTLQPSGKQTLSLRVYLGFQNIEAANRKSIQTHNPGRVMITYEGVSLNNGLIQINNFSIRSKGSNYSFPAPLHFKLAKNEGPLMGDVFLRPAENVLSLQDLAAKTLAKNPTFFNKKKASQLAIEQVKEAEESLAIAPLVPILKKSGTYLYPKKQKLASLQDLAAETLAKHPCFFKAADATQTAIDKVKEAKKLLPSPTYNGL